MNGIEGAVRGQTVAKTGLADFTERLATCYHRIQDMEAQVRQIADGLFGYQGEEVQSASKEADVPSFDTLLLYTNQALNRLQNQINRF